MLHSKWISFVSASYAKINAMISVGFSV